MPMRPVGLARGAWAFGAAWLIGAAIALLTGASAVVILLVAGLVAAASAAATGAVALRGAQVRDVTLPATATVGEACDVTVELSTRSHRPLYVAVRSASGPAFASGWCRAGRTHLTGQAPARGVYDAVDVRVLSAGLLGVMWWSSRTTLTTSTMWVAPAAADESAPTSRFADDEAGVVVGAQVRGHDELDTVRPWRDGDEVSTIHWPSSLRAGEVVVRQQRADTVERVLVEARTRTDDPTAEAARVRTAVELSWARGAAAAIRVGDEVHEVPDPTALLRFCARFDAHHDSGGGRAALPWWSRPLRLVSPEPSNDLSPSARWWVAAACTAPVLMMLQPLGYGLTHMAVCAVAIAAGAAVTARRTAWSRSARQLTGLAAALVTGAALIDFEAIGSPAGALRYLMPQLLLALFVMQGFECADRRAARVTLAISTVLITYTAGIRVDPALGPWLLVGVALVVLAMQAVTRADRIDRASRAARVPATGRAATGQAPSTARRVLVPAIGSLLAVAALMAALAFMPVPRGPATLTLPTWLEERRSAGESGDLATPTGSPLLGGAVQGGGNRTGAGAGGYPGFSNEMNTSLRGDLGDDVVLRVRAPAPDYWRGQTFTRFDGTTWFVEEQQGSLTEGPDHWIGMADGDVTTIESGEPLVQTFYLEADLPNIVFAAARPYRLLLDAGVWQRPDGALRADVVLPAGSAYTVLSTRPSTTADALRAQADISVLGAPVEYLQLPDSTSQRTIDLAAKLAAELPEGKQSTYDVILAIQAWLAAEVKYELDAPVPPPGADAVDHFLFESKRGFCEQIASTLAVMLRSLGVPARIATGYVPSERDEIAGVWVSRARDAHAWVEVRFPSFGWVAFDPTASVPLAGESGDLTLAGELVQAIVDAVTAYAGPLVLAVAVVATARLGWRAARSAWRRRRRGRWGVLQDRFVAAATRRGASPNAPNAHLAALFDDSADARWLALTLDESAFAADWADDDARYQECRERLDELERV